MMLTNELPYDNAMYRASFVIHHFCTFRLTILYFVTSRPTIRCSRGGLTLEKLFRAYEDGVDGKEPSLKALLQGDEPWKRVRYYENNQLSFGVY